MSKKTIVKFLDELISQLELLSDADIKKLDAGEYTLGLKVVRKNEMQQLKQELNEPDYSDVLNILNTCDSRELGYEILKNNFTNKKELEAFAKKVNVYVMKQDKVDKIREKIIEGIVGATLRSNAIQKNDTK